MQSDSLFDIDNIFPHLTTRFTSLSSNVNLSATSRLLQTKSIGRSPNAGIAVQNSNFRRWTPVADIHHGTRLIRRVPTKTLSAAQPAEIQKSVSELLFADVLSAVNNAMDKRRFADEVHLEQMAHKKFDDYREARIGELITADFQPAFLINGLLHQCVMEPTVESAVNHKLHVALASSQWPTHCKQSSLTWPERTTASTCLRL